MDNSQFIDIVVSSMCRLESGELISFNEWYYYFRVLGKVIYDDLEKEYLTIGSVQRFIKDLIECEPLIAQDEEVLYSELYDNLINLYPEFTNSLAQ